MGKALTKEEVEEKLGKNNLKLVSEFLGTKKPAVLKCFCGKEFRVNSLIDYTRTKCVKSCGCLLNKYKILNLENKVFNRITVIKKVGIDKSGTTTWECKCSCGKIFIATGSTIVSGNRKSCGCLLKELRKDMYKGYEDISKSYFSAVKANSKIRNLEFTITIEDVWEQYIKQNKKCLLSGVDLCFVRNYKFDCKLQTASIDRVDSKLGYTKDNIQIIHKDVNQIKWDLTEENFLQLIEKIYNYRIKSNVLCQPEFEI